MIKSLFGEDEKTETKKKDETKPEGLVEKEDSVQNQEIQNYRADAKEVIKKESPLVIYETIEPFEVDHPIGQPDYKRNHSGEIPIENKVSALQAINSSRATELEKKLREIEEELRKEKDLELQRLKEELKEKQAAIQKVGSLDEVENEVIARENQPQEQADWNDWDKSEETKDEDEDKSIIVDHKDFFRESKVETIRNMGMAWSAAIALFGAVVIMLVIGWFADLLLGTSPWGIVVGIVIGSIIGFLQFFRTTAQIINPKPSDFEQVSLQANINIAEDNKIEEIKDENPLETKDQNIEKESDQLIDLETEPEKLEEEINKAVKNIGGESLEPDKENLEN